MKLISTALAFFCVIAFVGAEPDAKSFLEERAALEAGISALNTSNWQAAVFEFSKAIDQNPQNARAYEYRGAAYYTAGMWTEALNDDNKAIELQPNNAQAYYNRGTILRAKQSYTAAINDFNRCLSLDPTYDLAFKGRSACYRALGDFRKEIADLNQILKRTPEDTKAILLRAEAYVELNLIKESIADYYQVIKLDSGNSMAYNEIAWLRATSLNAELRNGKEAVEKAQKACELTNWKEADFIDTLAAAYAEMGDFQNAVKHQKQAIELAERAIKPRATRIAEMKKALQLYASHKPFRDTTSVPDKKTE